ncbi:hypothetical protein JG688_00000731 [Phytophthora aleatoria]|uniref:Uncharacterized protein n=1 Tax=Phytophthora aleatoria TaxID=2496075 RepID=A0A8J5J4S0_9STRA|nr:hypothetical protein JG688_00000731 [Phytophthora aleatoria]
MLRAGFKLRWAVMATVALTLMTATLSCNTPDSYSSSASGSTDDWSAGDGSSLDGDGNGNGHGCTEEALWCPSLGQALSRDPDNNCEFPPCP